MSTIDILRFTVLASSVVGMLILLGVASFRKDKWLYTVPPFLLCANIGIFAVTRIIIGALPAELVMTFNLWATVIQLQLAFTVIGIGGVYLWQNR